MVLTLNMEFISVLRQDFVEGIRCLSTVTFGNNDYKFLSLCQSELKTSAG